MWIYIIVFQGQGKFEPLAPAEQEDPQQEAQIALQSFHLPRPIIRVDQASVQMFNLVCNHRVDEAPVQMLVCNRQASALNLNVKCKLSSWEPLHRL